VDPPGLGAPRRRRLAAGAARAAGGKNHGGRGEHGGRLKLKIAAPPVDNKANAHLLAWLAAQLGVPKSAVRLVRGESSRQKTVAVSGVETPWLDIENNNKT
jgi:uncharacterized protein